MSNPTDKDIGNDVENVARIDWALARTIGGVSADARLIAASNIWLGQILIAMVERLPRG